MQLKFRLRPHVRPAALTSHLLHKRVCVCVCVCVCVSERGAYGSPGPENSLPGFIRL